MRVRRERGFLLGFLALSSQDSFSEEPSEELSGSSGDLLGGPRIPTYLTGVGINFANEIPSAFASRTAPPPPPPDLNVESKPCVDSQWGGVSCTKISPVAQTGCSTTLRSGGQGGVGHGPTRRADKLVTMLIRLSYHWRNLFRHLSDVLLCISLVSQELLCKT